MADDIAITAGSGTAVATDEIAARHFQRIKLVFGADGVNSGDVSDANPLPTTPLPRLLYVAATGITRPSDTTAYAANDAVANSTTAGSVTPFSWTLPDSNDAPFALYRCRIQTTCTGLNGAQFRLFLFNGSSPTAAAGDNAAFNQSLASYIGSMSGVFRFFATEGSALLVPDEGVCIAAKPTSGARTIFGLLQTLSVFTPSSAATFTPTLEAEQGRP